MQMNISPPDIFRLLGQPIRVQIILILGYGEACVCHIEAVLGIRQAVISQHLMVLRDAGLVVASREGRNIFYRITNPALYPSVMQLAETSGITQESLSIYSKRPVEGCPCPSCNPGIDPELSCKKIRNKTK